METAREGLPPWTTVSAERLAHIERVARVVDH